MRKSFGSILDENNGLGPGFDLLRLALAIGVLMAHVAGTGGTRGAIPSLVAVAMNLVGYGDRIAGLFGDGAITAEVAGRNGVAWLRPFSITHVPMFFALSGFLVTGSAFRTKRVLPFLGLRFFRIFPALLVEVALSAVLIGSVFTTLSLSEYFTHRQFLTYFGNILGIVQMELPGVSFAGKTAVNANLWTLPSEFWSYLLFAMAMITGLAFNRAISTTLFAIATACLLIANFCFGFNAEQWRLAGNINVYYFFMGAMFFHWRHKVPYSLWLLVPALLITYGLEFTTRAVYVIPLFLTYITVFIGLTKFPRVKFLETGDYSYGIYLYSYPITRALYGAFPILHKNYFGLASSALLLTAVFAFLSWHLVEKRFLGLRRRFPEGSIEHAKSAARDDPTRNVQSVCP